MASLGDKFNRETETDGHKVSDDYLKENAEFHEKSGLSIKVKREYDGVGLHNGKDDCQFCRQRCGEWDNYRDAYDAEAFVRHPGCGCEIEYVTAKGEKVRQTRLGGDWKSDGLSQVDSDMNGGRSNRKYTNITNIKKEYQKSASPGEGVVSLYNGIDTKRKAEEISDAHWIHRVFGGDITLIDDRGNSKSADYLWRGKLWERKGFSTTKFSTIDDKIRKADKQISENRGGILLDFSKSPLDLRTIARYVCDSATRRISAPTDIIVKKGDAYDVIRIKK